MPKLNAHVVDANVRARIFETLNVANIDGFSKVNDRQWGTVIEDETGTQRYVRIGVIVAKASDDMTAQEMMAAEHDEYLEQKKKAEEAAEARKKKAAEDKARREKKAAEKEKE